MVRDDAKWRSFIKCHGSAGNVKSAWLTSSILLSNVCRFWNVPGAAVDQPDVMDFSRRIGLFVAVTQAVGLAFSARFGDSVCCQKAGLGNMMLIRTYVAASAIEGVGVFAAEPIRKGASIWRLDPDFDRLVPTEKYEAAPAHLRELLDRYAYPSPDQPGFMVYEVDNGRFMNHAGNPNTDFSQYGGATATRDIAAGEEITCDYGEFFEDFERLHLATV